jgi:hypothetical protein
MESLLPYLTPGAVAALAVLGIIRGWIYPGRVVNAMLQEMRARLLDRDAEIERLRDINAALDKRLDMLVDQVRLMVDANRTSNAALRSLPIASSIITHEDDERSAA